MPQMFHLRHLALLNLHLPSLHARELALLFHAIASLPALTRAGLTARDAVPFGLEVMLAQTKGVDALNGLVRRCKGAVRRSADPQQKVVWRERLRRVGVVLAGLLIDIGVRPPAPCSPGVKPPRDADQPFLLLARTPTQESVAALHLLGPLVRSPSAPAYVLLAAHRLHLLTGDLAAAARVRARLASPGAASGAGEKAVAGALESLARGEWEQAGEGLAGVLQNTPPDASDALVVSPGPRSARCRLSPEARTDDHPSFPTSTPGCYDALRLAALQQPTRPGMSPPPNPRPSSPLSLSTRPLTRAHSPRTGHRDARSGRRRRALGRAARGRHLQPDHAVRAPARRGSRHAEKARAARQGPSPPCAISLSRC